MNLEEFGFKVEFTSNLAVPEPLAVPVEGATLVVADALNLHNPIRITNEYNSHAAQMTAQDAVLLGQHLGVRSDRSGIFHLLWMNPLLNPELATWNLWHESTHAAQMERIGSERTFTAQYVMENYRRGYSGNRFEREAEAFAQLQTQTGGPLFVPAAPRPLTPYERAEIHDIYLAEANKRNRPASGHSLTRLP